MLLGSADVHQAPAWAGLSPALRAFPPGAEWAARWLPVSPTLAQVAYVILLVSAAFALVGLFARTAAGVAALTALYLLTLPQLAGMVMHTHHLVWFPALLAASPCGDALSVDAWWARRRGLPAPEPSLVYGLPLRLVWAMVALIYFFPGMWKWRTSGLDWALGDNLVHLLHGKWLQQGWMPALRIDLFPGLLRAGGLGVMALEVAFPFLVASGRLRPFAVASALLFHLATEAFFRIGFSSLWLCYAAFVPWHALVMRLRGRKAQEQVQPTRAAHWVPAAAVGGAVLVGQLATGVLGLERAWPVACYPTFRHVASSRLPVLLLEVEHASGRRSLVPREDLRGHEGQRRWGAMWAVLAAPSPQRLEAYWREHAARLPSTPSDAVRTVRFYRAHVTVAPGTQATPSGAPVLLHTLELTLHTGPGRVQSGP
ncbi:MAG: HTTM domain-containing protein [Myxococcaceae bacterium]|nr:HTTM domain-containing protein [Myxococcaceae bacterium]MCI0672074.1 HTTM domain-containing protein [Myxococcaceae bacterium]